MIVMEFEKVIRRGEKKYKILSAKGILEKNGLPECYLEGKSFYIFANTLCFSDFSLNAFEIGAIISEKKYFEMITFIEDCCIRLEEINKKIKELNHTGTFVKQF